MARALVIIVAAIVGAASLCAAAVAGTPTLRDRSPEGPGAVRHTVWQPVSGAPSNYGQNGYGQPTMPASGGYEQGLPPSHAPASVAERKSIGSELKKGAEKLYSESERALRNTGEAIEGTAKNITEGVERAFSAPPQSTPPAPSGGYPPYSYNAAPPAQQTTAPPFNPAATQSHAAQSRQGANAAPAYNRQQPTGRQQAQQPQRPAGEEHSVVVQPGQGNPPPGSNAASQPPSYAADEQQRMGNQRSTASTGGEDLNLVAPALGDPRGAQPPAGTQPPGGSGADNGQGRDSGLVTIQENSGRPSGQQYADQQGRQQAEPDWAKNLPPASTNGFNESRASANQQSGADAWPDETEPSARRPAERDQFEAGFAHATQRQSDPAGWGDDIAGPSGEHQPSAAEAPAEKPPYGALVFATLVSVFSLGWNVYLGFNYLDARNKYRAALRRSGREYSEALVDA